MFVVKIFFLLLTFTYILTLSNCSVFDLGPGERIIQTITDSIGAENFTYYRLHRDGLLKVVLQSLEGDVDIYISSINQHPSYDKYELKSETCGIDTITVPSEMSRPVYVSLYGHPNYLHSKFKLLVVSVPKPVTISYEDFVAKYERYYFDDHSNSESFEDRGREPTPDSDRSQYHEEKEMPIWWKIFLGILEFGIEVIL